MQCSYFDAGVCRSCTRMGVEYHRQLAEKEQGGRGLLSAWPGLDWLPSVASAGRGSPTWMLMMRAMITEIAIIIARMISGRSRVRMALL